MRQLVAAAVAKTQPKTGEAALRSMPAKNHSEQGGRDAGRDEENAGKCKGRLAYRQVAAGWQAGGGSDFFR